jgi:type III secretion system YscD/HrpQ family protein
MPAHLTSSTGVVFSLEEGEKWIIGRDSDACHFVLDDSTVSRKHAEIAKTPEGFSLKNLSTTNALLVNDEEIRGSHLLLEGDRIQIGHEHFTFSEQDFPENATVVSPKKISKKGAYDDIFGELEEPQPPAPREELEHTEADVPKETPYDTIFEDTDEPLPLNLLSPAPLMIKVISGPNAGAEFGIEKGHSYTLGKDPNVCEVAFQDLSVSRTHARLSVTADGIIEIEDLGSKNGTVINGVAITEKRAITPQDIVSLGTTVFLLIDRDAPQETIYSSMIPTPAEAPEPTPEEPVAIHWKHKPIATKHLVMGGSFLTIFLIMFISFFSLFRSEDMTITEKEPVAQLQEALAKYKDVQHSFNPGGGKLFLTGHVLNSVEYQELAFQISQLPWIQSVENTIVIDELVSKMANDVLSVNAAWRGVSVQAPKPGEFVVVGYLSSGDEAKKLWDYMTVNFPYTDRLKNELVVEETLQVQVQNTLATKGFGAVTFQLVNGNIILSGRYNHELEHEFTSIVQQLNKIQGVTKVENYAMAVTANMAAIDLTQQFQVGGVSLKDGVGYSVVLNGKVYTIDGMVGDMKLKVIEPTLILLEKDGLKYRIDYTR